MNTNTGLQMLDIKDVEKILKRVDEIEVGDVVFYIGEWYQVTEAGKTLKANSRSTRLLLSGVPFRFANFKTLYVKVGA
jgi:hypothetical protein